MCFSCAVCVSPMQERAEQRAGNGAGAQGRLCAHGAQSRERLWLEVELAGASGALAVLRTGCREAVGHEPHGLWTWGPAGDAEGAVSPAG